MAKSLDLGNIHIVVTAGPTWEALDPVRGLTNRSSGKMGYAIAQAACDANAKVTLISGPVCLSAPEGAACIDVQSAQDMYDAVHAQLVASKADVFISVAAVADYRPADIQTQKIKKSGDRLQLDLVKNPDIVASVGKLKTGRPFTVGFAAETQNVKRFAQGKVESKNLDLIAANDVSDAKLGFGTEQNRLRLFAADGTETALGQDSKYKLAQKLLTEIKQRLP